MYILLDSGDIEVVGLILSSVRETSSGDEVPPQDVQTSSLGAPSSDTGI